jgi:hypothetical protein
MMAGWNPAGGMIPPPAGEKKAAESEDSRGENKLSPYCPARRTNRTLHFGGVDRCNQPVGRILTQMRIICIYIVPFYCAPTQKKGRFTCALKPSLPNLCRNQKTPRFKRIGPQSRYKEAAEPKVPDLCFCERRKLPVKEKTPSGVG